ncbi:MAG TPA: hypothetical protein VKM56_00910, partial [Verrucomicrobiae bacterium]|nr:hypothetical protein [Verrucomicrobiae bacterium]
IALRYDRAALRLDGFLDGSKMATFNGDRNAPGENGLATYFAVGLSDAANMGNGAFFKGQVDEIRIWNTARPDLDIRLDRFRRLPQGQLGLIAYWRCDELTGTAAYDSSGLGNDGRLSNSTLHTLSTAPTYTFVPILRNGDGTIALQFLSDAGQLMRLDASSDLRTWSPLVTKPVPANNLFEFEDNGVTSRSTRFYRLKAP